MLDIVTAPNSVLSEKAKEVKKVDKQILNLIEEMKISLASATDPIGVGLAAPQIGKSLKIFIAKPTLKSKVSVYINPIIKNEKLLIKNKSDKSTKLEGCLSLPSIWGEVQRFGEITLEYIDEKGQIQTKDFKGFMATIVQHEVDHLNGILFPKRVLDQKGQLYKSTKDKENHDVFEEITI